MTWYDAMWQDVRSYVLPKLENELSLDLYYHGVHHTRDDVVLAADRLAAEVELDAEASLLLKTAALYHDTGFLNRYIRNEPLAAEFAKASLPRFGFMPYQIAAIEGMIMATQFAAIAPHKTGSVDVRRRFGRAGALRFLGRELRSAPGNLTTRGYEISMTEWLKNQILFLESHTYFTLAAHSTRYAQKQENLQMLKQMLHISRANRELAIQDLNELKRGRQSTTLQTTFSIEGPAAYQTAPATA